MADFKKYLKTKPLEVALRGLRDVYSFACCCDLFLSGNTELMHFAVALRIPTLSILSLNEAERWVPAEAASRRVLRFKPGERVREAEFLRLADGVRRAGAEAAKARAAEPGGVDAPVRAERAPEPRPRG